jgi:hypothetical protein
MWQSHPFQMNCPFTSVEPADKQHLDMHQKPVKDVFSTTESMDIMILGVMKKETSLENTDFHMLFTYIYLPNPSNNQMILS